MLPTTIRKILFCKPGLVRPAASPALQTGHVANVNTRICAISNGPLTPIDLLGNTYIAQGVGVKFTQSLPKIGNALNANQGNSGYQITGLTVETVTSVTCAAIMWLVAGRGGANMPCICTNSTSASGGGLYFGPVNGGGFFLQAIGGSFKSSGFNKPVSGPVFFACSCDGSASSFVMTDLTTGAISSSTGTGLTFSANDGTYCYAATPVLHLNQNYQAAAMMSNADLTLAQLQTWAKNPWSFWYPV
jgi:hypothetical protein